ncbi:putative F-box domain-containing protein [Helianthus annuus]|nr:putative F-box domain-containing protein [Helianthus annuus]
MRMDDRLSFLPDDVIIEILSFVGIKDAIGTSVLSSRWRFMWTLIPHLTFSTQDFSTMDNFFHFVTHVMSRRNNQLQLSSFNLCFRGKDDGGVCPKDYGPCVLPQRPTTQRYMFVWKGLYM